MLFTLFTFPLYYARPFVETPLLKETHVSWFTASTTRERTGRSRFEYPLEEVIGNQVYIYYALFHYAIGV